MPVIICQDCQQRIVVAANIGDHVHNCGDLNSNETLGNEDVLVLGNWKDADGTSGTKAPQEVLRAGIENDLWGTRAFIEGADTEKRTSRGNRSSTHRTIQHHAYKKFD